MNNNEEENKSMPDAKTEPQAPTKKREKNPSYHVLRLDEGGWNLLTHSAAIAATNRKAAIVAATKSEAKKDGEFLVLPEAEYKPIKRAIETQTVDKFE
jgi:hypothetical protein